jgi:hypothetical protein
MELLATVYWVARQEGARNFAQVKDGVYAWGERKHQFASEEIKLAYRALIGRGWLDGRMPALVIPRDVSKPKAGPRLAS